MAEDSSIGPLPHEDRRLEWFTSQPSLGDEKAFVSVLLEQVAVAASQLERIALGCGISPLELTLEDLIASRLHSGN